VTGKQHVISAVLMVLLMFSELVNQLFLYCSLSCIMGGYSTHSIHFTHPISARCWENKYATEKPYL